MKKRQLQKTYTPAKVISIPSKRRSEFFRLQNVRAYSPTNGGGTPRTQSMRSRLRVRNDVLLKLFNALYIGERVVGRRYFDLE